MTIKEFTQTFKTFKLDHIHESILETIDKIEKGKVVNYRQIGKASTLDYFSCSQLSDMAIGQTFALASTDGIRVFRLEKIIKPKIAGNDVDRVIIDDIY